MEIYEITGLATGVDKSGVNYLQPIDSFQNIQDGFIYRQVLQSRQGIGPFAPRLNPVSPVAPPVAITNLRVYAIFEHILPDSTKQLLAFDANFLYRYNTATGVFDQIPFGGSMAPAPAGSDYAGFAITSNEFYISGTSYPAAQFLSGGAANPAYVNGGNRFVFTGEGIATNAAGSAIFFYNGTDVRDFTNTGVGGDNPNYEAPAAGALSRATYVSWFGERLNFGIPVIAAIEYQQGFLYSAIRTSSGNGDKFNTVGSGLLQADTYENMTGMTILGQIMALNFDRSNWTIEKTRDPFNPYFIRKVPSVLGTTAKFSAVSWYDIVKSIGRTGIITTDGRQSLRTDNKIPDFTADEIDQIDFDLTYGGFDRTNEQFLWAYKEMEADTDTQTKVLVNNYEFDTWSVYDVRLSVFGQTDLGLNLTWDDIYEVSGNDSWLTWDTTEEIWDKIGLGASVQKTLAGDDLGFIYQLNQDYDDYYTDITGITQAAQAVLTVGAAAFEVGDLVAVKGVVGMTEINNFDSAEVNPDFVPYEVASATATSVTLHVDSTTYTAYTSGGALSKVISFSAETIPFNPYRSIGRRCFVSHVEFLIDTNGGYLKVDVFADEEETPFKQDVLLLPSSTTKAREWVTMSVDQEANFLTFRMRQQTPAFQVRLTSMRLHCAPGGLTNG